MKVGPPLKLPKVFDQKNLEKTIFFKFEKYKNSMNKFKCIEALAVGFLLN